jgi:hypothetical protein
MVQNDQINSRICNQDRAFMEKIGIGPTAIFRAGLHTLRLYIRGEDRHTCYYLSRFGKAAPRPASGPEAFPALPAQVCPCPACPIRLAFMDLPHNRSTASQDRDNQVDHCPAIPVQDQPRNLKEMLTGRIDNKND